MPINLDMSLNDWFEQKKKDELDMAEWERSRVIKRCKSCGQPYSFEKDGIDPKECQNCRGEEGTIIR